MEKTEVDLYRVVSDHETNHWSPSNGLYKPIKDVYRAKIPADQMKYFGQYRVVSSLDALLLSHMDQEIETSHCRDFTFNMSVA
jgi:hypothetical protein